MAVVNAYVTGNAESVAVDTGLAARFSGGLVKAIPFSFEVAAADDDGSIYRIARISPRAIIVGLYLNNDVITGGTDYDLGLYKPLDIDGSVIDKDCFVDGVNMTTDRTAGAWVVPTVADGANMGKAAGTLAGSTALHKLPGVDVALTANTVGTAAGTIAGVLLLIDGV
jgi:hypothetical protein